MSMEVVAGLASVGAFLLGVALAILGMRRRDKAEIEALKRELGEKIAASLDDAKEYTDGEFQDHWRGEHQRDSENRTVRERVGLLEARCRERHGS